MYGVASTGTCSTVFSLSITGFRTLKSKEIAGDVHSFAWSPNGEHLHALDSTANSILNYYISGTPDLESLQATDIVTNATKIRQIITHPVGHRMYVVTQTTNELIDIPLRTDELLEKNTTQTRAYVLPKSYSSDAWVTTSLAISASNATLWTLTQSKAPDSTFIVTVFRLDPVTGAVLKPVARSSFKNYIGDGTSATSLLTPGPTIADGTDLVSFTTYPGAMTAVLGLTQRDGTWGIAAYGRALLTQDEGCCGEGAWVD
jgi:6-phosphogluconolactonase (cycloisomerase 2 family)